MKQRILAIILVTALALNAGAEGARSIKVAVVQMCVEKGLAENREKIARLTTEAMNEKPRLVIFPEAALAASDRTPYSEMKEALAEMGKTAAKHNIYLVVGTLCVPEGEKKSRCQLYVFGPQGETLLAYDKVWHNGRYEVPRMVEVDGVPCSFILCADRWSRPLESLPPIAGAKIIIECSNNFDNEWLPLLGWYWYVPRAIRNTAFVIFSNDSREDHFETGVRGHGHSAIIAPDGTVMAGLTGEPDRIITAELDIAKATRAMAMRRAEHPLFKNWWAMGEAIYRGQEPPRASAPELKSSNESVKAGFGVMECGGSIPKNVEKIRKQIGQAAAAKMDLVVFPELAVTGARAEDIEKADAATIGSAVASISEAARERKITAVVGAPSFVNGRRRNSAYVIGPDGRVLTRYDQIVVGRPELFEGGMSTRAMWFQVNGIWSIVTIGDDVIWNEMGELAALRGARLHCHLRHDRNMSGAEALVHDQLVAVFSTSRMLTIVANPFFTELRGNPEARFFAGSGVWDDLEAGDWSAVKITTGRPWENVYSAPRIVPGPANPLRESGYWLKTLPEYKNWMLAGASAMDQDLEKK